MSGESSLDERRARSVAGGPRGLHEGRRGDGREGERAKERKGGLCGGARAYRRAGGEHEDAEREHDGSFWVSVGATVTGDDRSKGAHRGARGTLYPVVNCLISVTRSLISVANAALLQHENDLDQLLAHDRLHLHQHRTRGAAP